MPKLFDQDFNQMRIEGQISRMTPQENANFIPAQLPIKFVMKKDSSGIRINDIETHHIPNAEEIISQINQSGGKQK